MKPFNISDDYRIATDENSWVLEKRSVVKKSKDPDKVGTESWSPVGWYPHLHQLVGGALRRLVHASEEDFPAAVHEAIHAMDGLVEHVRRQTEGRKIP